MEKLVNLHINVGKIGIRLFILNVYWLLFTLAGLLVFGVVPASRALIAVLLEEHERSFDQPIRELFPRFLNYYKSSFFKMNRQFLPFNLLLLLLVVDIRLLSVYHFSGLDGGIGILLRFCLLLAVIFSFFFLRFSLQEYSFKATCKKSLIFLFGRPLTALGVLIIGTVSFCLYYLIPGLAMVFGIAAPFYLLLLQIEPKLSFQTGAKTLSK